MADITREERINDAFVLVAGTLIDDYDVVDLLSTLVNTCIELLDVQAGGILLADSLGELELVASTSEEAETVELMTLAAGAGPCIDCYTNGSAISVPRLAEDTQPWPLFRNAALQRGFRAAHITPLRLHGQVIGAMNLMRTDAGPLSDRDTQLAQALADVATVGIMHERTFRQPGTVAAQLYLALDTRILIEQAKGALAQHLTCTMTQAFTALRHYARLHDVTLRSTAQGILDRSINIDQIPTLES